MLLALLLLTSAVAVYGDNQCGDRGDNKRKLIYVRADQMDNSDAARLTLLPNCHFSWQDHVGTYSYCTDCNNNEADILFFKDVTLPWGQTGVLQADTDIVFAKEVHGRTVLTVLQMRRRWSLCPLWPVCGGR
jgi:hypothetical protein